MSKINLNALEVFISYAHFPFSKQKHSKEKGTCWGGMKREAISGVRTRVASFLFLLFPKYFFLSHRAAYSKFIIMSRLDKSKCQCQEQRQK